MSKVSALKRLAQMVPDVKAQKAVREDPRKFQEYMDLLEEAYGSKSTRATNMGFDDRTFYHGTKQSFDKFDDTMKGSSTGRVDTKSGHFFTDDPSVASGFAAYGENPSIEKLRNEWFTKRDQLYDESKKIFDKPSNKRSSSDWRKLEEIGDLNDSYSNLIKERQDLLKKSGFDVTNRSDTRLIPTSAKEGGNVIPVKIRSDKPTTINSERFTNSEISHIVDDAQKKGADTVELGGHIGANTVVVKNPNQVRSTQAAFDPRFKDSEDLLSLAGKDKSVWDTVKGGASKGLDMLSVPQRYAMSKLAESMGIKGNPQNSEETAFNIVDSVSNKIGLGDSAPANAAKALGVAGMEVFADPLAIVPLSKIKNIKNLLNKYKKIK